MRDLAATGARIRVPVAVTCRVLKSSKQGYYQWLAAPQSLRAVEDEQLLELIRQIHSDDPQYGYRFITDELHGRGVSVSERRVWRICSKYQIFSTTMRRKGRGRAKRPGPPVHDDLLQRDFSADSQDQIWLADITEHPTKTGKLYVCVFKDVFSRRIVGYAADTNMSSDLAVAALKDALGRRGHPAGVTVHTDRGSQFRATKFVRTLKQYRLQGSMGRVGAAGDNAAMESFFSLLQKNVLNTKTWDNPEELRREITYWIEAKYNRKRRQRALGKLTPIEFELVGNQGRIAD